MPCGMQERRLRNGRSEQSSSSKQRRDPIAGPGYCRLRTKCPITSARKRPANWLRPCHVSSSNGIRWPGMIRPSCYPRDVEAVGLGCPCPDDDPIGPASSKARWFLAALFSRSLRWSCPCWDAFRCRAALRPDFLARCARCVLLRDAGFAVACLGHPRLLAAAAERRVKPQPVQTVPM
jgi:hypothetical protein